jgi:hypothetical protein
MRLKSSDALFAVGLADSPVSEGAQMNAKSRKSVFTGALYQNMTERPRESE